MGSQDGGRRLLLNRAIRAWNWLARGGMTSDAPPVRARPGDRRGIQSVDREGTSSGVHKTASLPLGDTTMTQFHLRSRSTEQHEFRCAVRLGSSEPPSVREPRVTTWLLGRVVVAPRVLSVPRVLHMVLLQHSLVGSTENLCQPSAGPPRAGLRMLRRNGTDATAHSVAVTA